MTANFFIDFILPVSCLVIILLGIVYFLYRESTGVPITFFNKDKAKSFLGRDYSEGYTNGYHAGYKDVKEGKGC